MNTIGKVVSSEIKDGVRIVKMIVMGDHDVQTAQEAAPFGVDSCPLPDTRAIYLQTLDKGEPVAGGYINEDQLAAPGEVRLYALDADGNQKLYLWIRNNGIIELGGTADHAVRYSKLEEAFNKLKDDFNNLVQVFNAHTHPYTDSGSAAVTTATATAGQTSTADITGAKINEIKTL